MSDLAIGVLSLMLAMFTGLCMPDAASGKYQPKALAAPLLTLRFPNRLQPRRNAASKSGVRVLLSMLESLGC